MTEILKLQGIKLSDLERLNDSLRGGALACLPSETIYGLAGLATVAGVADRIYSVKGRHEDKPLALAFTSVLQIFEYLPGLPDTLRHILVKLLPGSVTAVLPVSSAEAARLGLTGATSVGVRVIPPPLDKLYGRLPAPLLLTSANISGQPDCNLAGMIPESISSACDFIIDAGRELPGVASTVVDLRPALAGERPLILRPGAVPEKEIIRRFQRCGCY